MEHPRNGRKQQVPPLGPTVLGRDDKFERVGMTRRWIVISGWWIVNNRCCYGTHDKYEPSAWQVLIPQYLTCKSQGLRILAEGSCKPLK